MSSYENISRDFVGRGYVKVTKDGNTTITYSAYASIDGGQSTIENNCRSLQYVAQSLKNDTAQSALYQEYKNKVDAWANGNPAKKD